MAETISVRVGKGELNEISWLREVLEKGLNQKRLEIALEKYRNNEATAARAAKIAGISLSRFLTGFLRRKWSSITLLKTSEKT